jgi:FdhD protein
MNDLQSPSTKQILIEKIKENTLSLSKDTLSIEEPLEIRLSYFDQGKRIQKNVSITMRTPGDDPDLALGFLFTEGIISSFQEIKSVYQDSDCSSDKQNKITVELHDGVIPNLGNSDRNFYTTSSCGVCGKSSIDSIKTVNSFCKNLPPSFSVPVDILYNLPSTLKAVQEGFSQTGGIHASGLFDLEGKLLSFQEDVGRHNALDKLIGKALKDGMLPLNNHLLLLSGRASFELIQKAAMAGFKFVAAIGAPSSLAVDLAEEFGVTLIGFLKEDRMNIYCGSERVKVSTQEK